MKLLVITQKVDEGDPILGFFHGWLLELAKSFESISVICLEKGKFDLPGNVRIYSLGKESKKSKIKYIINFYNYIVGLNKEYDAVFVHMNQEYVLFGGFFWKLMGKKVYFWRNHPHGNLLTRIAVALSNKVFYTSEFSYTAKFKKKAVQMPVGVDTDKFQITNSKLQIKNSILSLGRISPIKNIHLMVEAARILKERKIDFVFDIVGDPVNPEDAQYKNKLIEDSKGLPINFLPGVANDKISEIYSSHEIFINMTPSGSYDKTILEAAVCGCVPFFNSDIGDQIGVRIEKLELDYIASAIQDWFIDTPDSRKDEIRKQMHDTVIEKHSLSTLTDKLAESIQ